MAKADLHIHTTASDGIFSAEDVVRMAADNNLATIAITDHDTFSGYFEAAKTGLEYGVRVIPGIEFTTGYNGRECHLLGYGFDIQNPELLEVVKKQERIRIVRARQMVKNLQKMGFDVDFDEVLGESGTGNIGRLHIAKVLFKKGYAISMQDVFNRYLGENKPGYAKSDYQEITVISDIIKKAGGVSVLAHPGNLYIWEDLRYFLNAGIDGVEFIHPTHNYELQKKYKDWARNFGLLLSGGSDFHGKKRDLIQFGTISIDDDYADAILEKAKERQKVLAIN